MLFLIFHGRAVPGLFRSSNSSLNTEASKQCRARHLPAKRRLLQSLPHSQLSLLYNPPLILHQSACRQRFWSRLTTPIYKPGIGNKTCLCFLYLSPKSVLYCLSFCLAHCCICAQATTVNKTVLQLLLTKQIPTHAIISNR